MQQVNFYENRTQCRIFCTCKYCRKPVVQPLRTNRQTIHAIFEYVSIHESEPNNLCGVASCYIPLFAIKYEEVFQTLQSCEGANRGHSTWVPAITTGGEWRQKRRRQSPCSINSCRILCTGLDFNVFDNQNDDYSCRCRIGQSEYNWLNCPIYSLIYSRRPAEQAILCCWWCFFLFSLPNIDGDLDL